jgi:hypothetical protein
MEDHVPRHGTDGAPSGGPENGAAGGCESAPSVAEARVALDALDADSSRLAARLVTPWWYHLVLGVMVCAAIGAQALPRVTSMTVIVLVIIWIPFLIKAYTSRYKVWMSEPAGPRSRRMMLVLVVTLVVLMASGVLMRIGGLSPWWVLVPAALGLPATVWLGRRYDAALRADLSTPAPVSPPR